MMGDKRSGRQLLDDYASDSQTSLLQVLLDRGPAVFDTMLSRISEKCKALAQEIRGISGSAVAMHSRPVPPEQPSVLLRRPPAIDQRSLGPPLSVWALGLQSWEVAAALNILPPTLNALVRRALSAFRSICSSHRPRLMPPDGSDGLSVEVEPVDGAGDDPLGRLAMWEAQEEVGLSSALVLPSPRFPLHIRRIASTSRVILSGRARSRAGGLPERHLRPRHPASEGPAV